MRIEYKEDNDAFQGYSEWEHDRILDVIKSKIKRHEKFGEIFDLNGNHIGDWSMDQEDEE